MKRVVAILALAFAIGLGVLWANRTGHHGLLVLVGVLAVGVAVFRLRAAKGGSLEETERFFGEAGEDTRLTGMGASPSEMPVERDASHAPGHKSAR